MSNVNEIVVEHKNCKQCDIQFEITDKDLEFYDKVSPIFNSEKYSIPSPTLCPDCRQQTRLTFRNEGSLYKRTCDATGKELISMYSPDKVFKVYDQDFWWSDKWSPLDYGKDFDFSRGFFEQFRELMQSVPRFSVFQQGDSEGSKYTNVASNNKDCYLVFSANFNEDCYYWVQNNNNTNCVDCLNVVASHQGYELINSNGCHNCSFSSYIFNSRDCHFSNNLNGCNNCFLSVGLNSTEYCILNKQYDKDEYFAKIKELKTENTYEQLFQLLGELKSNSVHKSYFWNNNESSSGDFLFNNNNCKSCFDVSESEDCKYVQVAIDAKNCMDYSYWGRWCEKVYQSMWVGYNCSNILFCTSSATDNYNLLYCDLCNHGIKNCFWCIGLHGWEEYCIFNKQYTKEEYEELVPKIIQKMKQDEEWWEFFPRDISPFGYNESVAQDYFSLHRNQAREQWFNWSDYEAPFPKAEKIIPATRLPENISDIPDDILNWAIECEVTKKPFRIIKQELDFYRKHSFPIPKRHPDQRHLDRMKLRNPRKLFTRDCDKCGIEIKTTYNPDRLEEVYCETCYNKEIY